MFRTDKHWQNNLFVGGKNKNFSDEAHTPLAPSSLVTWCLWTSGSMISHQSKKHYICTSLYVSCMKDTLRN